MKDVTALRASEQRFREVFDNGPTPLVRVEPDGSVSDVNPALRRFLGVAAGHVLGRPLVALVHPDDHHRVAGMGTDANSESVTEARVRRTDGAWIWCERAVASGNDADGLPYSLVQLLDVDARKPQELRLQRAANSDSLTGVGNRQVLGPVLDELLADDGSGAALATSLLDIPSERLVQQALTTVLADRTALIIAHRLSTVAIADRVVVMRAGQVVEDGPPAELAASDSLYAALHRQWQESLV